MATRYVSTRGAPDELDFAEVVLAGLAPDGGLYCPTEIPALPSITGDQGYAETARRVMWPYVEGSMTEDRFAEIVADAYAGFRHPDVCPVVELGAGHFLLDLTQGPTLAFKDIALQLVGRLLDQELSDRGQRVVVISATSGDTGSAAIEALAGRDNVDAVVLHPRGRVSEVQRRQMTTVLAPNIHNVAVEGTFDDCQDLVKAAFVDPSITGGPRPAAVNSINWARVMAQIVYYVTAAAAVAPGGQPVSFAVPTGNFGNVLAGWYAKRMGLPIGRLIVASNRNDVLARFLESGQLVARSVEPSLSPSMDIQISSNFERLLWEVSGRDGEAIAELMARFRADGRAEVPPSWLEAIRADFDGGRASDDETVAEIARVHDELGLTIDPHTAVGLVVAGRLGATADGPVVTLSTADPAKFPDAVERAIGRRPPLPPFLAEIHDRVERYDVIANDPAALTRYLTGIGR